MFNYPTKFNGVSVLPAEEHNDLTGELKNVVTSSSQSLTGADNAQLSKAIANYVINGQFFTDSGVANAYQLTVVGAKFNPTQYSNGFTAMFKVGNSNTGTSTINVAGLGVKPIKKNNGADDLSSGDLIAGGIVEVVYDLSGDYFELTRTEFIASDFLRRDQTANVTVGYTTTAFDLGNSGTGTVTPLIANGHIQTLTINGNFTLAAPTDIESGVIEIRATVAAPGGFTINTAAYTVVENSYDSTSGKVNLIRILKVGSTSYISILPVPIVSSVAQGNFNAIINPEMIVAQEGTSFLTMATNKYITDGWAYVKSGSVVHTGSQSSLVPTFGQASYLFQNSLSLVVTTADASTDPTDFAAIEQRIEGFRYRNIAQKDMTLSFWVRSTVTGVYCAYFKNNSADRTFVSEYTINASNTWEKKTINITASPSAGGWNYTNNIGLTVGFTLYAGSTFQTSANSWNTGNFYATSNQVNSVNANSNAFIITGVQLEEGSNATGFIKRDFSHELELCQRYFEKSYNLSVIPGTAGATGSRDTNNQRVLGDNVSVQSSSQVFLTRKRSSPTMFIYSAALGTLGQVTQDDGSNIPVNGPVGTGVIANETGVQVVTVNTTGRYGQAYHFVANSRL